MAYAALVSVSQTLEQVLDSDPYFFPCSKAKLESFQETIASLLAFLDNCPPISTQTENNLVTQIRDSAYEAEDVFESLVATHFLRKSESDVYEKFKTLPQTMEKVTEAIESIQMEVKKVREDGNDDKVQSNSKDDLFMMAYTAISPVSQILEQVLDSDPYNFPCTKEKIVSFQRTIASLQTCLCNFPPISQKFMNLTAQIRVSVYEAKDVLDSLVETHILRKYGRDRYQRFKVFSESLEKVMEDIKSIEMEARKIHHDGDRVHERIQTLASPTRPTLSGYNAEMVVALDKDLEMKLMEQLVGELSEIDVVPIVGMGGIGKTTLARILCDSKLIKESFEVRGWATMSQTYNVHQIVLSILKNLGVPWDGKKDAKQLLYQSLYDRRYLIVLDDVWSTKAWDDMKRLFPDNNNGSRIMLTTRHSKVAAYANTFSTYHEMQLLNENSSWSLLKQEIFLQNNCPPELVEIGKEIARQCQGLPLAISAIGGHLKKEKVTKEYWKYVSKNLKSVLQTTNDMTLEILTLSYNYLPYHLKACFLYFGSFLEDATIYVSKLVKLWVAEGFVKPDRLNSMEEVAEGYLRDVVERNLVFVYKYDSLGKPKTCGIHDLFRDICIREAKKEKFFLNEDASFPLTEIKSQRRVIRSPNARDRIHDESPFSSLDSRDDSWSVIRCLRYNHTTPSIIKLAPVLLKVLQTGSFSIGFQVAIFELVNLKYLELDDIYIFPPSISRLWNLQTFVSYSTCIKYFPSEIWKMPQLRHLLMWGFHLPDISDVHGEGTNACILKSLQTLSSVLDFRCTQEVLTRIPNLRKLKIEYQEDVQLFHTLNNLVNLCELESLRCYFHFRVSDNILPSLAFPFSLKKLVLKGCQIPWEQMTIIGILPNLEVLKLKSRAMAGNLWETNDEEFKQLKFLLIHDSELVEWKTESDHFPRLRHLILKVCEHLEEIPYEIGEVSTLETIELYKCSHVAESSAKEMVGENSDIELKIVK